MCAKKEGNTPGLLATVLTNRCPRCRRGKLFTVSNPYKLKTTMRMPVRCPVCGQRYELQTGFYFGTGFVSYGISVMLLAVIFTVWAFTIGFSFKDNRVFACLIVATIILVALQPVLQRLARSVWIAFFVRYDPDWKRHGSGEVFI